MLLLRHFRTVLPILLLLVLLFPATFYPEKAEAGKILNDTLVTTPFRHHIWQEVLTQFLDLTGAVDLPRLRAYPKRLNQYLTQLEAASPVSAPELFPSADDEAAYWINAHNAVALRIILDHYPVQSLAQISDFDSSASYLLGGKPYSLKDIRQEVLAFRNLPQALFSLTDYSFSSPAILPKAYEGQQVKPLTRQAVKRAMQNRHLIRFQSQGSACTTILMSPFLKTFEKELFAPLPGQVEDQDTFAESPMSKGMPSDSLSQWNRFLTPFTPSAYRRSLSNTCSTVTVMSADKTLRLLKPL